MTPATPFRDAAARRDAIRVYRLAADRLGDLEQMQGGTPQAEDIHGLALIAHRALVGELDDRVPAAGPTRVCCLQCAAYLAAPSVLKLVPLDEAVL